MQRTLGYILPPCSKALESHLKLRESKSSLGKASLMWLSLAEWPITETSSSLKETKNVRQRWSQTTCHVEYRTYHHNCTSTPICSSERPLTFRWKWCVNSCIEASSTSSWTRKRARYITWVWSRSRSVNPSWLEEGKGKRRAAVKAPKVVLMRKIKSLPRIPHHSQKTLW